MCSVAVVIVGLARLCFLGHLGEQKRGCGRAGRYCNVLLQIKKSTMSLLNVGKRLRSRRRLRKIDEVLYVPTPQNLVLGHYRRE